MILFLMLSSEKEVITCYSNLLTRQQDGILQAAPNTYTIAYGVLGRKGSKSRRKFRSV
jgi:hypothetical protein